MNFNKKHFFWLFLSLAFLLCLFLGNGTLSLWDQDEASYAGFAQRMNDTGNYLIPDYEWAFPHRKTPFHFWLIAISFRFFGENEFALRLSSSLSILGVVGLIYYYSKNRWAAVVAATCILPFALAKIAVTDATLLFCSTWAFFMLLRWSETSHFRYAVGLWSAVGIGVLVKGPPIFITVGGTIFLLFLSKIVNVIRKNEQKNVILPIFLLGLFILTSLLPLFIWGRLAWLSDGGVFITWLLDWYIFKRAGGQTVFGQTGPVGYYLAIFALNFLAWLAFFPSAIWQLRKHKLMLFWCIFAWFFYEIVPSKLPAYAMGAFPVLCLLMGKAIEKAILERKINVWAMVVQGIISLGAIVAVIVFKKQLPFEEMFIPTLFLTFLWLWISVFNLVSYKKRHIERILTVSAIVGLLSTVIIWQGTIKAMESGRSFTLQLSNRIKVLSDSLHIEPKVCISNNFQCQSFLVYNERNGIKSMTAENDTVFQKMLLDTQNHIFVVEDVKMPLIKNNDFKSTKIRAFVSDRGRFTDFYLLLH